MSDETQPPVPQPLPDDEFKMMVRWVPTGTDAKSIAILRYIAIGAICGFFDIKLNGADVSRSWLSDFYNKMAPDASWTAEELQEEITLLLRDIEKHGIVMNKGDADDRAGRS